MERLISGVAPTSESTLLSFRALDRGDVVVGRDAVSLILAWPNALSSFYYSNSSPGSSTHFLFLGCASAVPSVHPETYSGAGFESM